MTYAWLAWLAVAVLLTWRPLVWHLDLFRTHSPPGVVPFLALVPVALGAGAALYHWTRRKLPRGVEPMLLLAAPGLVCLLGAPVATLAAAALFLSAYGIGSRIQADTPAARIGLRFGFGISVLILALFAAGLLGILNAGICVALLAPALFARPLAADLQELRARWPEAEGSPLPGLCLFFMLPFGALGALWSITPAIAFDPLKMHLATARWYAESGALTPLPTLAESYYPQGTELLMALLWILGGGQPGAQMTAPLFLCGTVLLLAALLRSFEFSRTATLIGCVAAVTLPFLHWTGFVAKNDAPLAFFLLASLFCVLKDRLPLAAFFLAMAFGIKHVALFGALGLTPLFLWRIWRSPHRVKSFAAVAAVFLAFGTISLVRTYVLKGDPLYPESRARAADFSVVNHPYQSTGERVMRYAGIPWLLHFDGRRAFESTSHNPLGVWLIFFFPAWIAFVRGRNRAATATLVFAGVYLLYWVSILVTLRYALLPVALLAAWTAAGMDRIPRWAATAAAAYCLFFSLTVNVLIEISAPQLLWFAGRLKTQDYLKAALPEYGAVAALRGVPAGRTFSLDNCALAYAPKLDEFRCLFMKDAGNDPARLAAEMREGGYRYLIVPLDPRRAPLLKLLPSSREIYRDAAFAVHDFVR